MQIYICGNKLISYMGRVRTKTIKRASAKIIEAHYSKLTSDFHTNKRLIDEVAIIQSKRVRNQIAGFTTHLMRRIQKGPVRGISLRVQEEERAKKLDQMPSASMLDIKDVPVEAEIMNLLKTIPNYVPNKLKIAEVKE
jgi:small subunit ribosomal protein S17e